MADEAIPEAYITNALVSEATLGDLKVVAARLDLAFRTGDGIGEVLPVVVILPSDEALALANMLQEVAAEIPTLNTQVAGDGEESE